MRTMLKVTWPVVGPVLKNAKWAIVLLAVLGSLSGYLVTLSSMIESELLNLAVQDSVGSSGTTITEALNLPLSNRVTGDDDGLDTQVMYGIVGSLTAGAGLIALCVSFALVFAVAVLAARIKARISRNALAVLRGEALRKALTVESDMLPSESYVAGRFMSAIHQGARLTASTYEYLVDAFQYVFTLGIALWAVLAVDARFAGFCVIVVVVQVAVSIMQGRSLAQHRRELDRKQNELNGYTDEVLSKRELILAHERVPTYEARVAGKTSTYADISMSLDISEAKYQEASNLVRNAGRFMIIAFALMVFIVDGGTVTTAGGIWFFVTMYARVLAPASNLINRYDSLMRSAATADTFVNLLNLRPDAMHSDVATTPPIGFGFEGVQFEYPGAKLSKVVLKDCSFRIPAGKVTLLIGPSGCGKSTIAKLLLGFWRHSAGRITVNDIDIDKYSREHLRRLSSYVPQEDFITDEPVHENLEWAATEGRPITRDHMLDALRAVMPGEPHPEDRLEGAAGSLSGGQKQRVAVARILLDSADVLILDEPLAGVDVFTLQELLDPLRRALKRANRTTLIITHRLVFAGMADHVIVMSEGGVIQEEGDPLVLSRAGKIYPDFLMANAGRSVSSQRSGPSATLEAAPGH